MRLYPAFAFAAAIAVSMAVQFGDGFNRAAQHVSAGLDRIAIFFERGVALVFDTLARPGFIAPIFDRFAFAVGSAPDYDAPPVHYLRHEAGTSWRAADRHV